MARYLITSGSHFNPFSYDDIIKPIEHAQKAYDTASQAYDQMEMDASALKRYVDKEADGSEIRNAYNSYIDKINGMRDELYSKGYNKNVSKALREARNMYASDISRINAAIEARQKRGEEYSKFRLAHPDMITGDNPGLASLNEYFKDDMYGQNYYTYSGNDFEKAISDAAKNIAAELNNTAYSRNKQAPGYLKRTDRYGFTGDEIQAVSDAIMAGNPYGLSDNQMNLYKMFMDQLHATGAYGNVSDSEYDRLKQFGLRGLTSAIGETKVSDLTDRSYVAPTPKTGPSTGGGGPQTPNNRGYVINGMPMDLQGKDYVKLAKTLKKQNKNFKDGPADIIDPETGLVTRMESPFEVHDAVYNPEIRELSRSRYGGMDIALSAKDLKKLWDNKTVTLDIPMSDGSIQQKKVSPMLIKDSDKESVREETKSLDADNPNWVDSLNGDIVGLYIGKNKIDKKLTAHFNYQRYLYNKHVSDWQEANPGVKLDEYGVTPAKEQELREQYGISPDTPSEFVEPIVKTRSRVYRQSPATFVGTGEGYKWLRSEANGKTLQYWDENTQNKNKRRMKAEGHVFYRLDDGKMNVNENEKTTNFKEVFGDRAGGVKEDGMYRTIEFLPEDLARVADDKRPVFRFTTGAGKGLWAGDISMLGDIVENELTAPIDDIVYNGMSVSEAVAYMMEPIQHPEEVVNWSPDERAKWAITTMAMLNDESTDARYVRGAFLDGMDAEDAAMYAILDESLQNKLYSDITRYINDHLSNARDQIQQEHSQYVGASSTSAPSYISYPTE